MPIKTISAAQFATAFNLRPNLVAWFLGAGASAASGIPTGYAMTRDFKAQIFCRETNLSKREIDTADPVWIDMIDAFFRKTSLLPPDGDPTEYAKAFEAVYPEARHRRQYIDDAISKGTPCFGHKVLGSLMAAGKIDCVFTTNFDPLIEESAHSANGILPVDDQNRPTVAAIDSADRAMRCLSESDWPLVAKLHGDYQSIAIKNTGSELEEQDARMRHVLVESGKRFGMIFVGYSGRDASIMEALNTVLDAPSPFPNGLYWLTSSASRLLHAVIEFLERAGAAGVAVAVVECATFDELAADIIKVTDLPKPLLLARSLELYQGRNGGNLPKRMVIHKTTAFKEAEIEGAFDVLTGVAEIECVEVSSASCWRGVWLIKSGQEKPPSKPSGFSLPRGTMVIRTGNSALVWVAGNAPEVSTKGDYYQGKKSIPRPLQLIRHAGSGPLELTAHEALALTKMDWNNDALYDPVPVSIRYSQKLARTIANVPDLPRNVYPYRLFM